LSRMRARVMVNAERLPAATRPASHSRSSGVRVTRYFLCGMAGLLPGDGVGVGPRTPPDNTSVAID
jgi:hypothetical protein